ncbi:MAG: hypothetical protein RTV72_17600 [Candidatus Thorarchaeota archaeon]
MAIVRTDWDTSTNKDAFKTLVKDWFDSTDREPLVEWKRVCKALTTSDDYERRGRYAGLDYPGEVAQGANIPIQDPIFSGVKDYTQVAYGTGFRITDRAKRTNKIGMMENNTKSLSRMQDEGKDVEIAKMFNNLTATTYAAGFDTLAAATNSHTCLDPTPTTYDNYGDTGLSQTSLEAALQYFDYMYDDQGNIFTAVPDTLVVNRTLRQDADELLHSTGKPHEMSNTKNAIQGELEPFVYHRLTATSTWFVIAKNNPNYGFFCYTLMDPDSKVYDAPDSTRDTIVDSLQYFKYGFDDPRMLYLGDG